MELWRNNLIADYQRKGIYYEKIICKRTNERQNRGRNQKND